MAGYREHISVSGLCGVGYGAAAAGMFGFSPVQGALAGCLTWVAGMLPDLDSQSGRPVRELFGLAAAVVPFVMMQRLLAWADGSTEQALLMAVGLYAAVRYGAAYVLGKLAVHRGMFHSLPALVIAAELVFLGYKSEFLSVRLLMAGGVALGFFSHLLLDELYSVEWTGIRLRMNQAAGSAVKLFSRSVLPNLATYGLLAVLTYVALIDLGLMEQPRSLAPQDLLRQAGQEMPIRR